MSTDAEGSPAANQSVDPGETRNVNSNLAARAPAGPPLDQLQTRSMASRGYDVVVDVDQEVRSFLETGAHT